MKTPAYKKKWQLLKNKLHEALRFLKKNNLTHVPWYLLLGPEHSGKTHLLTHAHIPFLLDSAHWKISKKSVFVDVPGEYFIKKDPLWTDLLKLMRQDVKDNLSGVILVLNFPELLKQQSAEQKKELIQQTKETIIQLQTLFGKQLPFYFIVSKCDLLPGFSEFFSDCGNDEATQIWGVSLPELKKNEKFSEAFNQRFDALIKRLNTQLIWKLHQERSPHARPFIKDFPIQVERLKETISNFLKALKMADWVLSGVYLTSALQYQTEDKTAAPAIINQTTHQTLELARSPHMPNRPYFIHQVFKHGLSSNRPMPASAKPIYAFAAAFFALAVLFLGIDFYQGVKKTYFIQNQLTEYQTAIDHASENIQHLDKVLPLLNSLHDAANNSNRPWTPFNAFLSFYSNKSQNNAKEVYQKVLQTVVMPQIKKILENELEAAHEKNLTRTYATLKAYLMLDGSCHLQASYLTKIISDLIAENWTPQEQEQFRNHLHTALDLQPSWQLNKDIIAQVRRQLFNIPSTELGLIILKNTEENNEDQPIALGTNIPGITTFISKGTLGKIPQMYTAESFNKILSEEISTAAAEVLQGNEVLGNYAIPSSDQVNMLTVQIRERYISNYVDVWESLLDNIQIGTPKNLTQLDGIIVNLLDNHSPLLQLLQTIQKNTAFPAVMNASPKLASLSTLLSNSNDADQNPLFKIFVVLKQMHTCLQSILHHESQTQTSGDAINQLFVLAEQSNEPIKSWLKKIADESRNLLPREPVKKAENTEIPAANTTKHRKIMV